MVVMVCVAPAPKVDLTMVSSARTSELPRAGNSQSWGKTWNHGICYGTTFHGKASWGSVEYFALLSALFVCLQLFPPQVFAGSFVV